MRIYEIIWKDKFVDKLETKHSVITDEVEQVIFTNPHIRREEKGRIKGEDLYVAYGQTEMGRFLVVFFVYKRNKARYPFQPET